MAQISLPFRPLARAANTLLQASSRQSQCRPASLTCTFAQTRNASILGSLADNPGAFKTKKRRGRGPASGKGKTSGRGHKGQKQHGKVPAGFQGGQTPLEKVKGKKGFENIFAAQLAVINLDRIQQWIDAGRLDNTRPITVKELEASRCTHGIKDGVKLLARNATALRVPINIVVSRASATAIAAIEAAGGSVQTRYYTRPAIRRILGSSMHPALSLQSAPAEAAPADAAPTVEESLPYLSVRAAYPAPEQFAYRLPDAYSRRDVEYYRDPAHRGYLAYQVQEGEGPSLLFKPPRVLSDEERARRRKTVTSGGKALGVNRIF